MNRMMIATCCAAVLSTSSLVAAQSGSADTMGKGMMNKEMKVTGCVAQGSGDMGHFMLNNAMMSDAMMKDGMKKDTMKHDDAMMEGGMKGMSFMLMGGDLKAHVGHKVEVTGMMADEGSMKKDSTSTDRTHTDMAGTHTLNVKSVKMIAATCQ